MFIRSTDLFLVTGKNRDSETVNRLKSFLRKRKMLLLEKLINKFAVRIFFFFLVDNIFQIASDHGRHKLMVLNLVSIFSVSTPSDNLVKKKKKRKHLFVRKARS